MAAYPTGLSAETAGSDDDSLLDQAERLVKQFLIEADLRRSHCRQIEVAACRYELRVGTASSEAGLVTLVAIVTPPNFQLPSKEELIRVFKLTPREAEITLLLAQRESNKAIAKRFNFKVATAKRHTERILAKLRVSSRRDVSDAILSREARADCLTQK